MFNNPDTIRRLKPADGVGIIFTFLARQKPRVLSVLCSAQNVAVDGVGIIFTESFFK